MPIDNINSNTTVEEWVAVSNQLVDSMNTLGGTGASTAPTANTIPLADGLGKIDIGWIDQTLITQLGSSVTGNITFSNDIIISGDLTVNGTTTTISTENTTIEDNIIVLNNGETGPGVTLGTAGLEIDRGDGVTAGQIPARILFNETTDSWSVNDLNSPTILYKVWHEGNDGSGSTLDADTVDGIQGANIIIDTTDQTIGGTKTFSLAPEMASGLVIEKTSGLGIKVDNTSPDFPWRDITGDIVDKAGGGTAPTWVSFRSNLYQYRFNANGDNAHINFHIPHDYVPGSELYIHAHWSSATTTATQITWSFEATYALGAQGVQTGTQFGLPITVSVSPIDSIGPYTHIISEVQLTDGSGQISGAPIQPDGVICVRIILTDDNLNAAGAIDPFLHFVDLHYQSTNIGTKNKAPNFYS